MVISVLPWCMFRPQNPVHSPLRQPSPPDVCALCAICVEIPTPFAGNTQEKCASVSPFPATLTDHSQLAENTITLSPIAANLDAASSISPLLATLTKNTGGGVPPPANRSPKLRDSPAARYHHSLPTTRYSLPTTHSSLYTVPRLRRATSAEQGPMPNEKKPAPPSPLASAFAPAPAPAPA